MSIKGTNYGQCQYDYYGKLDEIVQLEYLGEPIKRVVQFKCAWVEPTSNIGTRVHKHHGIIEVNSQRSYSKYEPFILAQQAIQVYYTSYPEKRRDNRNWLVVIKTKVRSTIDSKSYAISQTHAYQVVKNVQVLPITPKVEQIDNLRDNDSNFDEINDDPTNDRSTDDEVESEEFYYSDSINEDNPTDYVGSDDD